MSLFGLRRHSAIVWYGPEGAQSLVKNDLLNIPSDPWTPLDGAETGEGIYDVEDIGLRELAVGLARLYNRGWMITFRESGIGEPALREWQFIESPKNGYITTGLSFQSRAPTGEEFYDNEDECYGVAYIYRVDETIASVLGALIAEQLCV